MPQAQARLGTGILTIDYPVDGDTRSQSLRPRQVITNEFTAPVTNTLFTGHLPQRMRGEMSPSRCSARNSSVSFGPRRSYTLI